MLKILARYEDIIYKSGDKKRSRTLSNKDVLLIGYKISVQLLL